MEAEIRRIQRLLDEDPEDARARAALSRFQARVFGDEPPVEPNKRYGYGAGDVGFKKLFYVKGFVPSHYFPDSLRAHVVFKGSEKKFYMSPGQAFAFNEKDGEVRWLGGDFSHVLFEWTESIVNEPLRANKV